MNRSYGTPADAIVGYTYNAETLCPNCIVRAVDPQATDYYGGRIESWLNDVAQDMGIDRMDERTFDSGEFPKVVFADQVDWPESCDHCGEDLL